MQQIPQIITNVDKLIQSNIRNGALRREFDIKDKRMAESLEGFMTAGGKSIRAAYVYAAAIAADCIKYPTNFTRENLDVLRFLYPAISIQFDHNWFLIHDDIEDDSLKRRGNDTLHIKYGLDFAINDGDFLRLLADECMLKGESMWDLETFKRMVQARTEMVKTTSYGQDYEFKKRRVPLNETIKKDVIEILENKTAFYTTYTPVRYPFIIAGMNDSEILKYKEPMIYIGIAFQLRDDILDLLMKKSEENGRATLQHQKFGKDYAGDLDEGKRTLPLVMLYEKCDPSEKMYLDNRIRNGPFDPRFPTKKMHHETKEKILKMMHKYGTIEDTNKIAIEYLNKGNERLKQLIEPYKAPELYELNNFCVYREF